MMILTTLVSLAAAAVLITVTITDIRSRRIPNRIMGPALAGALLLALIRPERLTLLLGGLIAAALLLLPTLIYGLEKAGGGDIKLALFLGLLLGWPDIVTALTVAFCMAALIVFPGLLLRRLTRHSTVAFGPFLALGGLCMGTLQWFATVL